MHIIMIIPQDLGHKGVDSRRWYRGQRARTSHDPLFTCGPQFGLGFEIVGNDGTEAGEMGPP